MTLPEPIAVTLLVADVLEALGVRYFIGGSLASAVQGVARATMDADVIADLRAEHIEPLTTALGGQFYFDIGTIRTAVARRSRLNLIHLRTMFKVDIFISKGRPFNEAQLERRILQTVATDPRCSVYLASPEDTILAKLDWYRQGGEVSDRQWRDVIGVLAAQHGRLDESYLRDWADQLSLRDLLRRAMDEAETLT
jgi:hypothetical protein